ncbi:MAG TPA: hypothetical protein VN616_05450 [Puia sp.]|nr:hypothetical protein [Puia sp.]
MHKRLNRWLFLVVTIFAGVAARAQDSTGGKPVEMADRLRADGKIYVVVAVLVTIFVGIIAYVIRLDRKISRFEKGSGQR